MQHLFSWGHLKEDLSACDRLQQKPVYKIALLRARQNILSASS
jgi:hypothetical protein